MTLIPKTLTDHAVFLSSFHPCCHSFRCLIIVRYIGTIAAFIIGSFLGWSSPVQPQLQLNATIHNVSESIWNIYVDDNQMSWVGSLTNLGALCGALSGGLLMDTFGRKMTLLVLAAPYLLAWLLIAAAINPGSIRHNQG